MQQDDRNQQSNPGRVRIRDFFYHLIVYVFILAIMLVVNGTGSAFVWLALVWGFAIALHGVYAYFG